MKQFDSSQLGQFTGTSKYYRISRRHLLTDGTRYLAEQAASGKSSIKTALQ